MNDYRILVVDDEEDLCEILKCEILKFNLEMEGYTVDTANSAEEALKLDLTFYNLLLLDVMMGEISGFKMASMLKKNKDTAGIPIIFITAKDTENDTVTGFNLGADDYISKPFSLREVIVRVKAVLRRTSCSTKVWSSIFPRKRLPSMIPKFRLPKRNLKFCCFSCRIRDVYSPAKTSLPRYGTMKSMYSTVPSMSTSPVCVRKSAITESTSLPAWDMATVSNVNKEGELYHDQTDLPHPVVQPTAVHLCHSAVHRFCRMFHDFPIPTGKVIQDRTAQYPATELQHPVV